MIRKARNTTKEIEAIHSLIAFGAKGGKILPRSKGEIGKIIDSFYVYTDNGKIVGCCALEIYNRKLAEIRSLVVLPSHQGKGIATKFVTKCIKKAKKKNIYEVLVITDRDGFFERLGFSKFINGQWPMFLKFEENKVI